MSQLLDWKVTNFTYKLLFWPVRSTKVHLPIRLLHLLYGVRTRKLLKIYAVFQSLDTVILTVRLLVFFFLRKKSSQNGGLLPNTPQKLIKLKNIRMRIVFDLKTLITSFTYDSPSPYFPMRKHFQYQAFCES